MSMPAHAPTRASMAYQLAWLHRHPACPRSLRFPAAVPFV